MRRRDFSFLLPVLAAAGATGQSEPLTSQAWRYEDLPVRERGKNRLRPVFNGELRSGFALEMHETELAAGEAPHPPHHHPHEELLLVSEGTIEVSISGKSTRLDPGSVAIIGPDEEHGWRNVGDTRARYFVIALGPDRAYRNSVGR